MAELNRLIVGKSAAVLPSSVSASSVLPEPSLANTAGKISLSRAMLATTPGFGYVPVRSPPAGPVGGRAYDDAATVAMSRLQPEMLPTSLAVSSITYSDQVPVGFVPLKS